MDFSTAVSKYDGKVIKSHIWDTAGQECFAPIIASYYRGIAGVVIVYDITRRDSFKRASHWLRQLSSNGDVEHRPQVILVGNKVDKYAYRTVTELEASTFAEKNNMLYCETSAKLNIDVHKFYDMLIQAIYDNMNKDDIESNPGIKPPPPVRHKVVREQECDASRYTCCCIC